MARFMSIPFTMAVIKECTLLLDRLSQTLSIKAAGFIQPYPKIWQPSNFRRVKRHQMITPITYWEDSVSVSDERMAITGYHL